MLTSSTGEKTGEYLQKANEVYDKVKSIRDILVSLKKNKSLSDESFDWAKIDQYLKKAEQIVQILKTEEVQSDKFNFKKALKKVGKVAVKAGKAYANSKGIPLADAEKFKIKKFLKKAGNVAVKVGKAYANSKGIPLSE